MELTIERLENLIISGYLSDRVIIENLSQREINHLVYFAYENNKFKALHELLPYWKELEFNKGANLINSLVDRFHRQEITLLKKIEDVNVDDEILNFYQSSLNGIKDISNNGIKECVNILVELLDYKLKSNFSNKLDRSLITSEQIKKMVKI